MKYKKFDIVVVENKIVQVLFDDLSEWGLYQDINAKKGITHNSFIKKATKDEIKWFCENTENINFIAPINQELNR